MADGKLRALDPTLYPIESLEDSFYQDNQFVERFYELITKSIDPPYAISVDGLWGSGKTTLMKLLQRRLESKYWVNEESLQKIVNPDISLKIERLNGHRYKDENEFISALQTTGMTEKEIETFRKIIFESCLFQEKPYATFWFNPWEYRQTESVVLAFLKNLASNYPDQINELLREGCGILFKYLLDKGIRYVLELIKIDKFFDEIIELVKKNKNKGYKVYTDSIQFTKNDFMMLINKISPKITNKPVIIFFDDLDRCLPEDAIKLLEAVKNLFVTPNCNVIFVCGIDTRVAKKFIESHYNGLKENFAINYFRKIFNLTIPMPYPDGIEKMLTNYISSIFKISDQNKINEIAIKVINFSKQSDIKSIRTYQNIVHAYFIFRQFYPNCEDEDDRLALVLIVLKEQWQTWYENFVSLCFRKNLSSLQVIKEDQELVNKDLRLKDFCTNHLKDELNREYFYNFFACYPILA